MIIKFYKKIETKKSPTCGKLKEILTGSEYSPNIALAINIRPTKAHYHNECDEIYFILDGTVHLKFYDPNTDKVTKEALKKNDLCVISKGIHHRITKASIWNRLCVINVPQFDDSDEHLSKII